MSSNGFYLRVDGTGGTVPIIIDASSNMLDWQPIFTNPPAYSAFQFLDADATNQPQRFYRARE